jgi:paraquat-inducible protein A
MDDKHSLRSKYGLRADVTLLWLAAAAALAAGLTLPVITFKEFIVRKSVYTIFGGIWELYTHHDYALAAVIFIFSVVFPMVKLLSLAVIWFVPLGNKDRRTLVGRLSSMGKWSMLDVYVVAMTVVIAKSSALVKAVPEPGIYCFGVSVILSILVSARIERLSKKSL